MRLEEAKKQYSGQWLAFHEFDDRDNPEGEIKAHSKDRISLMEAIKDLDIENLYITFASTSDSKQHAFML